MRLPRNTQLQLNHKLPILIFPSITPKGTNAKFPLTSDGEGFRLQMRIARTNPRLKIEFVAVKRTDDRFPLDPALGELPTLVRAGILYRAEFPVLLKDGDLLALHANQFRAAFWNV